jgi:hypothetical protein
LVLSIVAFPVGSPFPCSILFNSSIILDGNIHFDGNIRFDGNITAQATSTDPQAREPEESQPLQASQITEPHSPPAQSEAVTTVSVVLARFSFTRDWFNWPWSCAYAS